MKAFNKDRSETVECEHLLVDGNNLICYLPSYGISLVTEFSSCVRCVFIRGKYNKPTKNIPKTPSILKLLS